MKKDRAAHAAGASTEPAYVLLDTSMGQMVLELDHARAPLSAANILRYVADGFYDGTIFHRIIENFMIQGGGFTPDMQQKRGGKSIKNEWSNGLKNTRGTVALARLGGQADSATSQFFINVADNTFLDQPRDGAGYAVFGRVVAGMEVVDAMRKVRTGDKAGHQNVPIEPVVIMTARQIDAEHARQRASIASARP